MKKLYFIFLFAFAVYNTGKAQYVTIPDAQFVNWLTYYGFGTCMTGNLLDTTNSLVSSTLYMDCSDQGIANLDGIQYFRNLVWLNCRANNFTTMPSLQPGLRYLDCSINYHLDSLPPLPVGLDTLFAYEDFQLRTLPVLPNTLTYLDIASDSVTALPVLPASLLWLDAGYNRLTAIPTLPSNLYYLDCRANFISSVPALPTTLHEFSCAYNPLLSTLPVLPSNLYGLEYTQTPIGNLDSLPRMLNVLWCENSNTSVLPPLPVQLRILVCSNNQLTALPALPDTLSYLHCDHNLLTFIPPVRDSMINLYLQGNHNLACLPSFGIIGDLRFDSTAISCLPGYGSVSYSIPTLNTVPLCNQFNSNGCNIMWNIAGNVFYVGDTATNCLFDDSDTRQANVKVQLYNNGQLQQQVFTGQEGFYSFHVNNWGNYNVVIDTANVPFRLDCPASGEQTVNLTAQDSFWYEQNFGLKCRSVGYDLGVYTITNGTYVEAPGAIVPITCVAGDISQIYGAHCAAGVSGQVQITYTGQATFAGMGTGGIAPTNISGNVLTWDIADFGTLPDTSAFRMLFRYNGNVSDWQICIFASIPPTLNDFNIGNNELSFCLPGGASLDPNEKEVYPTGNTDTSQHWLYYTIRFQNVGTAPAQNIVIADTLSANLDVSTFQLLSSSGKPTVELMGNAVKFIFPNIYLPDTAAGDSVSRGYVQYKVKRKDGLPLGTQIQNTAYVYFDNNAAVVTNTTLNTLVADTPSGIHNIAPDAFVTLYPNPAHNYTTISVSDNLIGSPLQLTDAVGRTLFSQQVTGNRFNLPTGNLSRGVYLVRIGNGAVKKLVVE